MVDTQGRFDPPYEGVTHAVKAGNYRTMPLTPQQQRLYDIEHNALLPRIGTGGGTPAHGHDTWLEKPHWTETSWGRAGTEIVARMLGGAFFSWAQHSDVAKSMETYTVKNYRDGIGQTWLQWPAYKIDQASQFFIDRRIDKLTKSNPGMPPKEIEEKASKGLRFRELRIGPTAEKGRTLGAEITVVTFAFAAMSAGSAIARNLINGIFNPRERRSWLNEEGRFTITHTLKRAAKKFWEIVTLNAGEDAAVAYHYVYVMRHSRNLQDMLYKGSKYSMDVDGSGKSFEVDDKGKISGHYSWPGIHDLNTRFVIYNVFTQIYRDAYYAIGKKLIDWKNNDFALSVPESLKKPQEIPAKAFKAVGDVARYLTISSIRSILQMSLSVPFFSITRVNTDRGDALAIHPEKGPLAFKDTTPDGSEVWTYLRASSLNREGKPDMRYHNPNAEIFFSNTNERAEFNPFFRGAGDKFDPYATTDKNGPLEGRTDMRFFNWLGRGIDKFSYSDFVHNPITGALWRPMFRSTPGLDGMNSSDPIARNSTEIGKREATAFKTWAAYGPYFAAKVFFREQFVNQQMNLAIGRALDGALHLNLREFTEGVSEVQRTMMRLPFKDPERQAMLVELHRRNPNDNAVMPLNWTRENYVSYLENKNQSTAQQQVFETDALIRKKKVAQYSTPLSSMPEKMPETAETDPVLAKQMQFDYQRLVKEQNQRKVEQAKKPEPRQGEWRDEIAQPRDGQVQYSAF